MISAGRWRTLPKVSAGSASFFRRLPASSATTSGRSLIGGRGSHAESTVDCVLGGVDESVGSLFVFVDPAGEVLGRWRMSRHVKVRKGDLVVVGKRRVVVGGPQAGGPQDGGLQDGGGGQDGGVEVALTSTEFDLLAHLMSRPGRVFTREELLASVWGYATPAGTRTVDVHVAQVRAKLAEASSLARDTIRTVRGVGYTADGNRP